MLSGFAQINEMARKIRDPPLSVESSTAVTIPELSDAVWAQIRKKPRGTDCQKIAGFLS